jgi:hypothetical protein
MRRHIPLGAFGVNVGDVGLEQVRSDVSTISRIDGAPNASRSAGSEEDYGLDRQALTRPLRIWLPV